LETNETKTYFDFFTLANFMGVRNHTVDLRYHDFEERQRTPKYFYFFFDFGITAFLVLWLFFFKTFSEGIAQKINLGKT